ncbi:AAA family ATPase [Candidatus Woesearchaeota archaeon]|nr:AAA family ATPase [Candidatus Woesearchaeota archaeon]
MIPTGSEDLDNFMKGYRKGILTAIYGEPATGKTLMCLLASGSMAQQNNKIIYIDTECAFPLDRFIQLYPENYKELLNNIFVIKVKSMSEQINALENIAKAKNVDLVIMDSLSYHYRKDIKENSEETKPKMIYMMNLLLNIAKTRNIPVLLSNQVYNNIENNTLKLIGGKFVENRAKCIIKLDKGIKRKIVIEKHPFLEQDKMNFIINDKGIFRLSS